MGNRFEQNYHYTKDQTDYNLLRAKAWQDKLKVEYVSRGNTSIVDERGFKLFISNQDKFKDEIMSLGIEEIFYDCILKKHPKD